MDTNHSQVSDTASEPSISNAHNEASTNQLLSTDIAATSQLSMYLNVGNMIPTLPLVISDQSRVEILTRHRDARRTRRYRRAQRRQEQRTQHPHRHLAQQIRRRQMANQQFQQQEYYRNRWYDERERQEQQYPDHNNNVQTGSPTFHALYEQEIDDRLLELFDWDTIFSNDHQDRDLLCEQEHFAAMEQQLLAQEEMEQSQYVQAFEALNTEERNESQESAEQRDLEQLHQTGSNTKLNN